VNEAEWLACEDPRRMLSWVTYRGPSGSGEADLGRWRARPSDRKLRLFACACVRAHGPFDRRQSALLPEVERLADRGATPSDYAALDGLLSGTGGDWARWWAACELRQGPDRRAALLRDIFGNPFRPLRLEDLPCPNGTRFAPKHLWQDGLCLACGFPGSAALGVAHSAYDDRRPDGTLDSAALAVLADALEEAGCDEEALLMHLRGWDRCPCLGVPCCALSGDADPRWREAHTCVVCRGAGWVPLTGPHVRGCWVLDVILGKS
jgi:hypothetical protein